MPIVAQLLTSILFLSVSAQAQTPPTCDPRLQSLQVLNCRALQVVAQCDQQNDPAYRDPSSRRNCDVRPTIEEHPNDEMGNRIAGCGIGLGRAIWDMTAGGLLQAHDSVTAEPRRVDECMRTPGCVQGLQIAASDSRLSSLSTVTREQVLQLFDAVQRNEFRENRRRAAMLQAGNREAQRLEGQGLRRFSADWYQALSVNHREFADHVRRNGGGMSVPSSSAQLERVLMRENICLKPEVSERRFCNTVLMLGLLLRSATAARGTAGLSSEVDRLTAAGTGSRATLPTRGALAATEVVASQIAPQAVNAGRAFTRNFVTSAEQTAEIRAVAARIPDPTIRRTYLAVHRELTDMRGWQSYITQLYREAAAEMWQTRDPAQQSLARRGFVTHEAVERILIQRAEARGETFSRVRTSNPEEFFDAVRRGPFFDDAFTANPHNRLTHAMQTDRTASIVQREMSGQSRRYYDYLGSEDGRAAWNRGYDQMNYPNGTSPETIGPAIESLFEPNARLFRVAPPPRTPSIPRRRR